MSNDRTDLDAAIAEMVARFLSWKLPADFNPDCGVSFKPIYNEQSPFGPARHEPIGTNLLTADQARAMLHYVCVPLLVALRTPNSMRDVLAERQRQIDGEGFGPTHDDDHDDGQLAAAGSAYALNAADQLHPQSRGDGGNAQPQIWPWGSEWWKPKNPRRDLVRAAALILAEIDRIDRAAPKGRHGKKAAGRLLDGIEHNGFPPTA